jgi:hypothetical protein
MRAFGRLATRTSRRETGIKLATPRGLGWRARLFVALSVAAPLRAQGRSAKARSGAAAGQFDVENPARTGL